VFCKSDCVGWLVSGNDKSTPAASTPQSARRVPFHTRAEPAAEGLADCRGGMGYAANHDYRSVQNGSGHVTFRDHRAVEAQRPRSRRLRGRCRLGTEVARDWRKVPHRQTSSSCGKNEGNNINYNSRGRRDIAINPTPPALA
jgi:hypothetical protein